MAQPNTHYRILLGHSKALAAALRESIEGKTLHLAADAERTRLAAGAFDVTLEHHESIILLIENGKFGSAFTLLRSMFEGSLTGMWLAHLATPDQIRLFCESKFSVEPQKVIKQADDADLAGVSILKRVNRSWRAMSGYAHTGYLQIVRRNSEHHIGSNYQDAEIWEVLALSNGFAVFAGLEAAGLTGDLQFVEEMAEVVKSYMAQSGVDSAGTSAGI